MDVESGMSGKNRNAVHFNPSKRKGGGAGARGEEELKHFRTAWSYLTVPPLSGPHWVPGIQAAKFNKNISKLETQERTSSEEQDGKGGLVVMHCILQNHKDLPNDLP